MLPMKRYLFLFYKALIMPKILYQMQSRPTICEYLALKFLKIWGKPVVLTIQPCAS